MNQIKLTAVKLAVCADAGDDIVLPFTAANIDTTDWTLDFTLHLANPSRDGPQGDAVGSATVTNTPGAPDSSLVVRIAGNVTTVYQNVPLWGVFRRTNAGSERTLVKALFSLE
jgi:hypothetical protein